MSIIRIFMQHFLNGSPKKGKKAVEVTLDRANTLRLHEQYVHSVMNFNKNVEDRVKSME